VVEVPVGDVAEQQRLGDEGNLHDAVAQQQKGIKYEAVDKAPQQDDNQEGGVVHANAVAQQGSFLPNAAADGVILQVLKSSAIDAANGPNARDAAQNAAAAVPPPVVEAQREIPAPKNQP
jgi:hypothetical protein